MRVCSEPGCPALIPTAGRCDTHAKAKEQLRGSRQARGYGGGHTTLRKQWEPKVATGNVRCARCHEPIKPGAAWALDHDDNDRTKYLGPSHKRCNDAAGGKRSHQ